MIDESNKLWKLLPDSEIKSFKSKVPPNQKPLWFYWNEFVHKYLRTGKSEITVSNVRDALRFIIRNVSLYSIEQVNDHRTLEDFLHKVKDKRGLNPTTFNTYLKNLNTFFIWLHRQDYIADNNILKVQKCKQTENEQYILSETQVKQIVSHIHDRRQTRLLRFRNIFFIDLLRFTGARPCEIQEIQCKDIRGEKGTYVLVIHGKKQKGKPRYYRFPSWLRDSYENYVSYRSRVRDNESYLFISSSTQGRWTSKGMKCLFNKLSDELGFRVIAYGFRRYVATKLYLAEVPMTDIQQYLGHTRITTTIRYVERTCALTKKGADVMGKALN
ncbi:tyrosine-type recombinase/integrase [Candidatus Peregrinibacteria bacterium]|nr:tyrosine-type recombinase/integrase [Candidatus Peregrinibacteria bacterium]